MKIKKKIQESPISNGATINKKITSIAEKLNQDLKYETFKNMNLTPNIQEERKSIEKSQTM
jgi:hypothetical protein